LSIDGALITQSTALIEFIEETFDGPSLLPQDPIARARSRAFGQLIACEMYPVIGPKRQRHMVSEYGIDEAGRSGVDMSAYPLVSELDGRCRALPEFDKAMPQNHIDFPEQY